MPLAVGDVVGRSYDVRAVQQGDQLALSDLEQRGAVLPDLHAHHERLPRPSSQAEGRQPGQLDGPQQGVEADHPVPVEVPRLANLVGAGGPGKGFLALADEPGPHLPALAVVLARRGRAEGEFLRAAGVGAVVGYERIQVDESVVDVEVADAAHEVLVPDAKAGRYGGQAAQLQRPSQVQEAVAGLGHDAATLLQHLLAPPRAGPPPAQPVAVLQGQGDVAVVQGDGHRLVHVRHLDLVPLAVGHAARYARARPRDLVAEREAELHLGIDYFQRYEVVLLVVPAVVEEQAVRRLGGEPQFHLQPVPLPQGREREERGRAETAGSQLAEGRRAFQSRHRAPLASETARRLRGTPGAPLADPRRAGILVQRDLAVFPRKRRAAGARVPALPSVTSAAVHARIRVAQVDLRVAQVRLFAARETCGASARERRDGVYRSEQYGVAAREPRGVPKFQHGQALLEVQARLPYAEVVVEREHRDRGQSRQYPSIQVNAFLEKLGAVKFVGHARLHLTGGEAHVQNLPVHVRVLLHAEQEDVFPGAWNDRRQPVQKVAQQGAEESLRGHVVQSDGDGVEEHLVGDQTHREGHRGLHLVDPVRDGHLHRGHSRHVGVQLGGQTDLAARSVQLDQIGVVSGQHGVGQLVRDVRVGGGDLAYRGGGEEVLEVVEYDLKVFEHGRVVVHVGHQYLNQSVRPQRGGSGTHNQLELLLRRLVIQFLERDQLATVRARPHVQGEAVGVLASYHGILHNGVRPLVRIVGTDFAYRRAYR